MKTFVVALLAAIQVGYALPPESYRIVGGTKVIDDLPWMTQLYALEFVREGSQVNVAIGQCGGTLIAPNWILSAAHCALNDQNKVDPSISVPDPTNPAKKMYKRYAFVGSNFQTLSDDNPNLDAMLDESNPIVKVVCHPGFNPENLKNDICLYQLAKPSSNKVVDLNIGSQFTEEATAPGSTGVILGWGRTNEDGGTELDLKRADVPILPNLKCTEAFLKQMGVYYYAETSICAGGVKGIDSCQGDSGGPLLTPEYKQIGITSFGFGCARANLPAIYTRISEYGDWIKSVTGIDL